MSKKSIKKNYLYNASYQTLVLLAPLITTPYVSRVLGPDNIGHYSFVKSIVSYFALVAALGITTYGRREVSYVQDNAAELNRRFWETKILQIITSSVVLFVYAIFVAFQSDRALYLALVFDILFVLTDVTWYFQGIEDFGKIVIRNAVIKVVNIIFIFLMVKTRNDLVLYAVGNSAFLMLGNLIMWPNLIKNIGLPHWSRIRPFHDIGTVFSLFVPTVAIEVYTVLDKTMIGVITGDNFQNGYYEQAVKIAKVAMTIVTAVGPVIGSRIGRLFFDGEASSMHSLMYKGYRLVWAIGTPICFGLIGTSSNFIPWFLGSGYDEVVGLLHILSFLILAIGINNLTGCYLIVTKRERFYSFSVIVGAVLNFLLNSLFIPKYRAFGASIASISAETAIAIVQLLYVRKELSIKTILRSGIIYWFGSGIMTCFVLFAKRFLPQSILGTGILIIIGALNYVLILFLFNDRFTKDVFNKIKKQVKSKRDNNDCNCTHTQNQKK